MTPTYSAVLAFPDGKIGDNVQVNQLISSELQKGARLTSFSSCFIKLVIHQLTNYFFEVKIFLKSSFRLNLFGVVHRYQVWEDLLDSRYRAFKTNG